MPQTSVATCPARHSWPMATQGSGAHDLGAPLPADYDSDPGRFASDQAGHRTIIRERAPFRLRTNKRPTLTAASSTLNSSCDTTQNARTYYFRGRRRSVLNRTNGPISGRFAVPPIPEHSRGVDGALSRVPGESAVQARTLRATAGSAYRTGPECCTDLSREQLGFFPDGELSHLVHLIEVTDAKSWSWAKASFISRRGCFRHAL
jgi:hypothetical protein